MALGGAVVVVVVQAAAAVVAEVASLRMLERRGGRVPPHGPPMWKPWLWRR